MNKFYYDLHLHSCLSPCADEDNTPNNLAGMAALSGLQLVALTDHNSAKNCPAFCEAAARYGIVPVAGMELTSAEDIHIVCLFEELSAAMAFDEYVDAHRLKVKNRTDLFGTQYILDGEDRPIGEEPYFLPAASEIPIEEVYALVCRFGGVCYPAHIDRESNGILAILGTIPPDTDFRFFELHDRERIDEYASRYGIPPERCIVSSDAHYLTDMRDAESFFSLDADPTDPVGVRRMLFRVLRGDVE